MKKQRISGRSLFGVGEIIEILAAYAINPATELPAVSHLLLRDKINSLTKDADDRRCIREARMNTVSIGFRYGSFLRSGNTSTTLYLSCVGRNLREDVASLKYGTHTPSEVWNMVKDLGEVIRKHTEISMIDLLTFLTLYDKDLLVGIYRKEDTHYAVMETMSKARRGALRKNHYIGFASRASMGLGDGDIEITDKGEYLIQELVSIYECHFLNKERKNG